MKEVHRQKTNIHSAEDAESVVYESSADSDASSKEEEFLKVLFQLPTLANSTKAKSLMAREVLPSTMPRVRQSCFYSTY